MVTPISQGPLPCRRGQRCVCQRQRPRLALSLSRQLCRWTGASTGCAQRSVVRGWPRRCTCAGSVGRRHSRHGRWHGRWHWRRRRRVWHHVELVGRQCAPTSGSPHLRSRNPRRSNHAGRWRDRRGGGWPPTRLARPRRALTGSAGRCRRCRLIDQQVRHALPATASLPGRTQRHAMRGSGGGRGKGAVVLALWRSAPMARSSG